MDGTRTPFEKSASYLQFHETAQSYQTETSEDDSPWDISDNSSDAGFEADNASGANPVDQPRETTRDDSEQFPTEMGQVLKSTKLIIQCLYKLPLRKPAPIDRVKGSRGRDLSLYQHFDVLYVRDKFPNADDYLVDRLGKLISRRRQLLEYRVTHTERLQPPVASQTKHKAQSLSNPEASLNDSSQVIHSRNVKSTIMGTSSRGQSFSDLPSDITKATVQPPAETIASLEALYPPSVTESRTSTASEYTENQKPWLPPRPLSDDGNPLISFECPYCGIAKHIPIEPSRAWEYEIGNDKQIFLLTSTRSHVLRDLQPYVCTFKDCDMFDHMFDSRQAWFDHELELHRAKWSCNTCPSVLDADSPHLTFGTKEGFARHMNLVHKLAKSKLDRSIEAFRHPSCMVDGYCCLCGKYALKLKSHLGRHMEQIALFALPRLSLEDSGNSRNVLLDVSENRSRCLSSESDHESVVSESSVVGSDRPTAQDIDDGSWVTRRTEIRTAWETKLPQSQPKTPDPSSDPYLISASDDVSTERFPERFSDMSPTDALELLRLNLESIVALTGSDTSPPLPAPPIVLSLTGFAARQEILERTQKQRGVTLPGSRDEMHAFSSLPNSSIQETDTEMKGKRHQPSGSTSSPIQKSANEIESDPSSLLPTHLQYQSVLRKFYSKNPPPISIKQYLSRIHQYCPMSTAVYLATSLYIHRLAIEQRVLSITELSVHRLVLAGLRVSMKALEDLSYPHSKVAKVGGISNSELLRLEISFCFLTGFNLFVNPNMLQFHYESFKGIIKKESIKSI